jgi:mannitol/fructose-specific phosphotransferase system IIA component (Ntr-type)
MKTLEKTLAEGAFVLDLKAKTITSIFHQMLNHLVAQKKLAMEVRDDVERELLARERQISTAIGNSVAVPHLYLDAFEKPVLFFARLAKPVNLGALDGVPTRFVFLLLGPKRDASEHLDTLANISRLMSDDEFRYRAGAAKNGRELNEALQDFRRRTTPVLQEQRGAEVDEGLRYTGRPFGGMLADLRRRLPHYASDFYDGLHTKSVSSTLFLFFACLAPAVTFGGIMANETGNHIGAMEMILASALCGTAFALFSGQPLVILGGTGPLLIFTAILYRMCQTLEIDFLAAYAWVGLWTGLILIVLGATDASALMRFFTRFTDETFAALISIIFITKALENLIHVFVEVYSTGKVDHDVAFLTLLLALGTFYIASNLSRFRRSRYLLPSMREFLADFGPAIAMVAMTLVALWLRKVDTPNGKSLDLAPLAVPSAFEPTIDRAWLVNPFAVESWVWLAALLPALLATVLVYVDQNITARLVNNPDHKLHKGSAFHYDLAVVGVLIGACSLFGLPWLVAATVRSLNHVRSLATTEEVIRAGGDKRERILHVRETRLTGFSIHLLIGLSLLLLPLLKEVPMAVLYGLFLYMGVVSMAGNQFFERLSLWVMDSALYPATHYIRQVPNWIIHKFTFIQLACLLMLMGVERVEQLAIFFPLFLALLVPVRMVMGRFFKPEDLAALDAEEEPEEEETHWV